MFIKARLNYVLVVKLIFILLIIGCISNSFSKQGRNRQKQQIVKSIGADKKKTIRFKSGKRKKGKRVNTSKIFQVLTDSIITDGIKYKNIVIGTGRLIHSVHIIETDRSVSSAKIAVMKASDKITELQKLQDIIKRQDSLANRKVIGAINGSFWRAVTNFPIGPTFIDGEPVEMLTHKKWSSCFFDKNDKPYIDNFYVTGIVRGKNGIILPIRTVNRRKDSLGLVLYNRFAGDTIPYIIENNLRKTLKDTLFELYLENEFEDSTETKLDTTKIKTEILANKRIEAVEYGLKKALVKYITYPSMNREIKCFIQSVDTGLVIVPPNGFILSFGKDIAESCQLSKGDTIYLKFCTSEYEGIEFVNSVGGTPRLVRNGNAKHEAIAEGSRGRRFIGRPLARSALGYDIKKERLLLVSIEANNNGKSGASLAQLSIIMKKLGCYNAMNLDGGGSATMVINGKNAVYKSLPDYSRRLSVGIGIYKPDEPLKNIFKKGL